MHCWWECKLIQPLWKTVWRFVKKLKIAIPYVPAIPFLDIYMKVMKSLCRRDICTSIFTAVLFMIGKAWKQPKYPSADDWKKKMWYIYIQRILLRHKKEGNPAICDNTNEPSGIMLSKISQKKKNKYCIILLICGISEFLRISEKTQNKTSDV